MLKLRQTDAPIQTFTTATRHELLTKVFDLIVQQGDRVDGETVSRLYVAPIQK